MERKVEQTVGEDGTVGEAEKTQSKLKINHGDCTTTYTFSNEKMAFEGKGKAVNDDDWKVDLTMSGEAKQAESKWKIAGAVDVKGSDLGGAKLAMNVSSAHLEKLENQRVLQFASHIFEI